MKTAVADHRDAHEKAEQAQADFEFGLIPSQRLKTVRQGGYDRLEASDHRSYADGIHHKKEDAAPKRADGQLREPRRVDYEDQAGSRSDDFVQRNRISF